MTNTPEFKFICRELLSARSTRDNVASGIIDVFGTSKDKAFELYDTAIELIRADACNKIANKYF